MTRTIGTESSYFAEADQYAYESGTIQMERRFAPLPHLPGQSVEYAVTQGEANELQPLLYWNGWLDVSESPAQRATLAEAMAKHGYGLIVIKNDRTLPVVTDPNTDRPGAFYTHALHAAAVIKHQGLENHRLPGYAFSAGGLAATHTILNAQSLGLECFADSTVVYEGVAGLNHRESRLTLPSRAVGNFVTDLATRQRNRFSDEAKVIMGEVDKTGRKAMWANPSRALLEVDELATYKTPVDKVAARVGMLAIVAHGQDTLMRDANITRTLEPIFTGHSPEVDNVLYATPYSTDPEFGQPYGSYMAHHLDSFTNPSRPAATVAQLLG